MAADSYKADEHPSVKKLTEATDAQKAAAFEWLREFSLREGNKEWRHAAVMLVEIVRLNKLLDGPNEGSSPVAWRWRNPGGEWWYRDDPLPESFSFEPHITEETEVEPLYARHHATNGLGRKA